MAYDKKKSQQVSIRIPHDLWRKIKAHYVAQGIKRLSKNAMIVGAREERPGKAALYLFVL